MHVHELRNALNTAVHASTKFTPAFLNFGRHPLPPASLRREAERGREIEATTVEEWKEKMFRLENVRDLVRKDNEQAQELQAKAFNQGKQDKSYEVGQSVIRKVHYLSNAEKGVSAKLFTKFEGPYKILEVLSLQTYLLDQPSDCYKLPKVHSSQLKLHIEREPRWSPPEAPAPVRKLIEPPPEPTHNRVLRSQTRRQAEGKGQGR